MAATLLVAGVALVGSLTLVLFAWGWILLKTDPPVPAYLVRQRRRKKKALPQDDGGPLTGLFDGVGRPFGPLLLSILGPEQVRRARQRIAAAGKTNAVSVEEYARRRAGSIVLFGVLGILLLLLQYWAAGVVFIALGQLWVDGQLWLLGRKRSDEIERQLPDFLDILAVTVSAGLGFRHALTRVTETVTGPLAEEFTVAISQMDLGTPRREAFQQLRARNSSPSLNQFLTAVLQAEELGAPLSEALVGISADMRQNTAQQARRRAARTAPRIQLVVVFALVPAFLLLFIGALIITLLSGDGIGSVFG